MDFITVPALSVFVLPTLSAYSSRLNLLFFYMSWTTLVLSLPALRIEMMGTLVARLVFWIIPSCTFFLFDALVPNLAVNLKEGGEGALPSGSRRHRASRHIFFVPGVCLANFVLSFGCQWLFEQGLEYIKFRPAVQVTIAVPLPWHIATHLFLGFLFREILSYSVHRWLLHSRQPALAWIVKQHNSWFHALRGALPLTAHYDHPLAYLLHTFLPMYIPVYYLRFHAITFFIYTVLISIEETFTYSGYSIIPFSILQGTASRVNMHLSDSRRYFGRLGLVDFFLGTGALLGGLAGLGGGGGGGDDDRGRRR
ncbi:hypothetical protein BJY01DRAFT_252274 [Aspergillus pseudoustus]|uniref:Fatty acid hydroxylase domain-containing protein n=1 Tax=Aspergillus pseudoustus TaxID=1810923 RepID=A0ABR4J7F5_9EURO